MRKFTIISFVFIVSLSIKSGDTIPGKKECNFLLGRTQGVRHFFYKPL